MPEPISTSSGSAGKTISKSFSLQPKCTLSFDNETAGSLSDALSHCWYNLSITSLAWASSGLPGHYSEYSQDLGCRLNPDWSFHTRILWSYVWSEDLLSVNHWQLGRLIRCYQNPKMAVSYKTVERGITYHSSAGFFGLFGYCSLTR